MHNPPCETWQIHLRRELVRLGGTLPTLEAFVDDVRYSWETELQVSDPEFMADFERATADTRQAMELARRITA